MNVVSLFATASTPNNPLAPGALKQTLERTVAADAVLSTYCSLMAQQPRLEVERLGAPEFAKAIQENVERGRAIGERYLRTVNPQLLKALVCIISFGNRMESFREELMHLLPSVPTDPQKRELFRLLLDELFGDLGQTSALIHSLAKEHEHLREDIARLREAIERDLQSLARSLGVDRDKLATVREKITEVESANADKTTDLVVAVLEITGGTAGSAIGLGVLAMGVLLGSGGTLLAGLPLFIAGVGATIYGIIKEVDAVKALNNQIGNLTAAYQEAAELDGRLAIVEHLSQKFSVIAALNLQAAGCSAQLANELDLMARNAQEFRKASEDIRSASDVARLEAMLRNSMRDWSALTSHARTLQSVILRTQLQAPDPQKKALAV